MSLFVLIALVLAGGLWLVISVSWRATHSDFVERIAPQLRSQEVGQPTGKAGGGLLNGLGELTRSFIETHARKIPGTQDTSTLENRLLRGGKDRTIEDFRSEQILWAVATLTVSVFLLGVGVFRGKISVTAGFVLSLSCALCGFWARDWWLTREIEKREKTMLEEFPVLLELMALSVAAGESVPAALERVCACSRGDLAAELRKTLAQAHSGDGLVAALHNFSQRTGVAALARFVDAMAVCIDRGTPISDVLRAQAHDARDAAKRNLMETAGKKEIAMMAPIIFCILPLTVIFALFPGLSLINLNF